MSNGQVDYDAIAKKHGGVSAVDYDALAKKHGGAAATAAATEEPAASDKPDSILGGFARRAVETGKGLYQTFVAPPKGTAEETASSLGGPGGVALYRTGKGIVEMNRERYQQVKGDIASGSYGKAALHALTPPELREQMTMAEEGRYREALGSLAFDVTATLLGSKGKPKLETRLAKLTAATGEMERGTVGTTRVVLPDIDAATKRLGQASSIGDYENLVKDALNTREAEFNQHLQLVQNRLVDLSSVRQRILNLAQKTNLTRSERNLIMRKANRYLNPQNMRWLNDERTTLNANTDRLRAQSTTDYATMVKSNLELQADEAARKALMEREYDVMDRAFPGKNFAQSKSIVGQLWELKDQLADRIKTITDKEYTMKGRTFWEKYNPYAFAGKHFGAAISGHAIETYPKTLADVKVRQAFGTTKGKIAARAAVLGAPLARLSGKSSDSDIAPPPEPEQ